MIQSKIGKAYVDFTAKGAAQPGLNLGDIAKYRFGIPPLTEQYVICKNLENKVSKIERLIQKSKEASILLRERRVALISAAVTGKIDVRNA